MKLFGTDISYPVVQTRDNEYYLTRSFKKESNKAGWIFADYRNNLEILDKNTIIYGHNRLDKNMFGTLENVLTKEWLENNENHVITLTLDYRRNKMASVLSLYNKRGRKILTN